MKTIACSSRQHRTWYARLSCLVLLLGLPAVPRCPIRAISFMVLWTSAYPGCENGSNCGQDCCDQMTACNQTKQNGGVYYDLGEVSRRRRSHHSYQTQYQCGGYTGKCHSIPGGYY